MIMHLQKSKTQKFKIVQKILRYRNVLNVHEMCIAVLQCNESDQTMQG